MNTRPLLSRNVFLLAASYVAIVLIVLIAYLYVISFSLGYRMVIVVHGGALFFLGCAIFLKQLRRFLIFVAVFCIPLQFGYHLIHEPVTAMESQPFVSGIRIDSVDVILMLLYAHWAVLISRDKGRRRVRLGHPIGTLLLIWIVYCFVASLWTSVQWRYSLFEVIELTKGFLLYLYVVNNTASKEDFLAVVYGLFANTLAHGGYLLMQYVTGLNYSIHGVLFGHIGPEGFRSVGFFGSPDAASALISVVFPVGVAYFLCFTGRTRRSGIAVSLILLVIAVMCTKVRASGFAILISSFTILWLCYWRGWISSWRLTQMILVGAVLLALISPFVVERFRTGTYGADRIPLMLTAVNMIKDQPVLGVGVNNYAFRVEHYVPLKLKYTWSYIVHNEYLLRLAETGAVGFLLYYSLLLAVMVRLWRTTRSPDVWIFVVSAGFLAALIGSLPHRLVSFYHYLNFFLQWCVVLALTQVMTTFEQERQTAIEANPESGEERKAA